MDVYKNMSMHKPSIKFNRAITFDFQEGNLLAFHLEGGAYYINTLIEVVDP